MKKRNIIRKQMLDEKFLSKRKSINPKRKNEDKIGNRMPFRYVLSIAMPKTDKKIDVTAQKSYCS